MSKPVDHSVCGHDFSNDQIVNYKLVLIEMVKINALFFVNCRNCHTGAYNWKYPKTRESGIEGFCAGKEISLE